MKDSISCLMILPANSHFNKKAPTAGFFDTGSRGLLCYCVIVFLFYRVTVLLFYNLVVLPFYIFIVLFVSASLLYLLLCCFALIFACFRSFS